PRDWSSDVCSSDLFASAGSRPVATGLDVKLRKPPEGRHTATNLAGNRTAPRTCEPKEHAAYVAPPGLPEYTHRSQWLTPLAKICRRSAAAHVEHDAALRNKSWTDNASSNRSLLSGPGCA